MKKADKIRVLKLAIKLSFEGSYYGMKYTDLRSYGIFKNKYLRKEIASKKGSFWYTIGDHWNVRRTHLRAALKELRALKPAK